MTSVADGHDRRYGVGVIVSGVAVIGLVSTIAALTVMGHLTGPRDALGLHSVWIVVGFMVGAAVAEIVRVPLMHGDGREELTFFEIATVAGILVVTPVWALGAPLVGLALAQVLLRRRVVKALFNLGSYATATAAAIVVYLELAGGSDRFSVRAIVALILSMLVFAAINTTFLMVILHASLGLDRVAVLREVWALSGLMTVGSIGTGAVAVALVPLSPILVPFTAMPALALWYAFRAAAQRAHLHAGSNWLVVLAGILAEAQSPTELLARAPEAIRSAFAAQAVRVVMPGDDTQGVRLAEIATDRPAEVPAGLRPPEWTSCVATRLELEAGQAGVLLLGGVVGAEHSWHLQPADTAMLTAVAASLGSALRGAEHLQIRIEESSKLRAVVAHASDGIAVVSRSGRVRLWSPAMARMSGVDETVALAGAAPVPAAIDTLITAAQQDLRGTSPLVLQRPDGDERHVLVSVVQDRPFGDGEHVAILTVHDVTAQARADRLKADFVATISHELRTPITPIKGYAQLLAARGDAMTPERRQAALELIADRADHLGRLVDDLLMASRVSGPLAAGLTVAPAEHDLLMLTAQATTSFPALADRLSIAVPDAPVPVFCDGVRTVQCLSNLISNAGKYSPDTAPIAIVVDAPTPADTHVSVHVADVGPGLDDSDLDRVFDRFYRVEDPMTMTTSGSGLGLYIARELAAAMGGSLTVSSVRGKGSPFTLTLPRTASSARSVADEAPPVRPLALRESA